LIAGDVTDRLLSYLSGPEGTQLVLDIVADIGGDAEEYGIGDVTAVNAVSMSAALKYGLEMAAESALIGDEAKSLVESDDVDWSRVTEQVDAILIQTLASAARQLESGSDTPTAPDTRLEEERQAQQALYRSRTEETNRGKHSSGTCRPPDE
jgi:hypothetical protein